MPVNRMTMFKFADEKDIPEAIDKYYTLHSDAKKDGKPYIRSSFASQLIKDHRSAGFNLVAYTTFDSLDDMKYYDEECEAHKAIKAMVGPKVDKSSGPPVMMFASEFEEGKRYN